MLALVAVLSSRGKFARGPYKKHLCEIIFNLMVQEEMPLKIFLIYSSGSHLVWRSKTSLAILVEVIMRNISVRSLYILTNDSGDIFI